VIPQEAQYREWMLASLQGDASCYRKLLAELTRHLRGYYARRLGLDAAEDAVQETLIAIHAKRGTYDPTRPFTAWVYGIARYKLIDVYRRERRGQMVALDAAGDLFASDQAEEAGVKRDVEKLLAKLPEAKRRLVRAVKLDGETIADAAQRTGLSEVSVKVTVHRAVKAMSESLRDNNADG
jgi:RNA polymerase sigma factor (sigma-70 family)